MKIGDLVTVVTGCIDCGNVDARILEIVDDNYFVEVIGDLPHKAQARNIWVKHKHIRARDE
jgi:hypothetical protein